jgi:copper(I)-binding protein
MALGCFALATAAAPSDVVVTNAWARPTVPGQAVGAAYLNLTSAHGATLTLVQSDAAGMEQLHVIAPVTAIPLQQGTP